MSAELDNAAAHGSSAVLPMDSASAADQASASDKDTEMAPTNNEPIASGTATDTEHVSNIDPALASELDLPPSPAKDHHNHTDDAEGESEVEAEDERDQLGNESEISSPPTPSPPPPSTRKTAPSTSSDKDKGTSGTPAKITRVFQACEHCKKRKCRCDGVQPTCKVCMRLGIQCVYAPERRMRGPSKNKKNGVYVGTAKPAAKRGRPPIVSPDSAGATNGAAASSSAVYNPYLPQAPQPASTNGDSAPEEPNPAPVDAPPAPQLEASTAPGPDPPSSFPRYVSQQSADQWASIPFPSNTHKEYTFPPILQENLYRFPTPEMFNGALEQYLKSLSRKAGDKALPTQKMYDAVLAILRDEGDAEGVFDTNDEYLSSPIFRAWANKAFTLSPPDENGDEAVLHNGKPVAVREQLYNIMVSCHAATRHGGRDKTCSLINDHYSWVPKAFVELFVKSCPGCPRKLGKSEQADSVVKSRRGKRRNPSESPAEDGDEASDELPSASASSTVPGEAHTNGSSPRKRMKVDPELTNGDDASAPAEMVIA